MFYTYSTLQFELVTLQMFNSQTHQVAIILDRVGLDPF